MFTEKFDSYVCEGDCISCDVDGYTITARVVRDDFAGEPWKEHDGHGPVSDWVRRSKRAGELVLAQDRGSYRYYDFQEAVKIAKRDGWGPGTPEQAARHDYESLKAWCDDEWFWCVVVLSVSRAGVTLDSHAASLGGIECNYPGSDNAYLTDVAEELLPEALEAGKALRAKLCA